MWTMWGLKLVKMRRTSLSRRRSRHHRYVQALVPFPEGEGGGDDLHVEPVAEIVVKVQD
jgi:hypothetical protein